MKLITKRLILRDLTIKDAKYITENINNLKVSRYLLVVPYPYYIKDGKNWIKKCIKDSKKKKRVNYEFAIMLKTDKKVIGAISLREVDKEQGSAKIGYWLGKKYWRQGIMSEAFNEIINFAFKKLKLRRLDIEAFKENNASNGLIKKMGFKYEGRLREYRKAKSTGRIHDANIYGLLRKEWRKHKE